ncbi:MAG TPA: hypothetical protein VE986_07580 [Hyphomicrobiales bacterium]|nr:hypothetical protein [Hyphomicrobiales bacterium]
MSEDPASMDDDNLSLDSTIEALEEIADIVETIILGYAGEQRREAYLALADEYEAYANSLPEEESQRTPEENGRLKELTVLMTEAFRPLAEACPAHIRKVHEAVLAALDAEQDSEP